MSGPLTREHWLCWLLGHDLRFETPTHNAHCARCGACFCRELAVPWPEWRGQPWAHDAWGRFFVRYLTEERRITQAALPGWIRWRVRVRV